ncbi:hypothetical protein BN946_scf184992.g5 [Trametes cinnabarina]|uniref:HAT C-terminal dimerisation domain-containing protein n=1 Tax=Pycnoporus cinnabarinus TaxID=5643 RepID=A0A060S4D6_PYCCI|nr:hypothetical protein BN946_scf184992.g5 [Trametes cinnabarina]
MTGYRDAPVFKNGKTNPLAINPIRIRRVHGQPMTSNVTSVEPESSAGSSSSTTSLAAAQDKLVARVGICLQNLLLCEYGGMRTAERTDILDIMKIRNPQLASLRPVQALKLLQQELKDYTALRDPFDRPFHPEKPTVQWWRKVMKGRDALKVLPVLAIKIFSVVPNSMADERLMSVISWINGPRRSGQDVQTVADHLTIRQHYMNKDPRFRSTQRRRAPASLTVQKWCDLDPQLKRDDPVHTDGIYSDDANGVEIENSEIRERDEQAAVDALCEGAKLDGLAEECHTSFVAGSDFDLQSEFLRELLADDCEVARARRHQ